MNVLRSLVLLLLVIPTLAEARMQTAPAPKLSGFKGEFVANLNEVQEKILELAESTPADAYAWRPAPDVRSISEVYMHIAGGNYFLATFLDIDAPKVGDLEKKFTKKTEVIAELKKSFDHLRSAANRVSDLEKPVKMFGNQTSHRGVLVTMLSHLHEHLGQSIAYARMNGVVPPWSR
ncbi:MAG TPA: DinB family protein [Thermoanaerobaculia bacterium]|nr:DinB family protein [Thermoanaerobaculia bacterium]